MPLPARTLAAQPDRRRLPLRSGSAAAASGVAEAPSVETKLVVLVFGMQDLEIASSSTKKGPKSCENCSDWH